MQKLTANDLLNLKYGDTITQVKNNGYASQYRYVGRMPSSPNNYLILSAGEKLIHIYIPSTGILKEVDDCWYGGDFDVNFTDKLMIEYHEKQIELLKKHK
jgi:hypothetical protein